MNRALTMAGGSVAVLSVAAALAACPLSGASRYSVVLAAVTRPVSGSESGPRSTVGSSSPARHPHGAATCPYDFGGPGISTAGTAHRAWGTRKGGKAKKVRHRGYSGGGRGSGCIGVGSGSEALDNGTTSSQANAAGGAVGNSVEGSSTGGVGISGGGTTIGSFGRGGGGSIGGFGGGVSTGSFGAASGTGGHGR